MDVLGVPPLASEASDGATGRPLHSTYRLLRGGHPEVASLVWTAPPAGVQETALGTPGSLASRHQERRAPADGDRRLVDCPLVSCIGPDAAI